MVYSNIYWLSPEQSYLLVNDQCNEHWLSHANVSNKMWIILKKRSYQDPPLDLVVVVGLHTNCKNESITFKKLLQNNPKIPFKHGFKNLGLS